MVYIFICIFFAYLAYRHKRNAIILITIGVTFITVLLAESVVYYQSTGDFFHRLHETERNYEVCKYGFFTEGSPWGWEKGEFGIAIKNRLFKEGPKKIFMTKSFGGSEADRDGHAVYRMLHDRLHNRGGTATTEGRIITAYEEGIGQDLEDPETEPYNWPYTLAFFKVLCGQQA